MDSDILLLKQKIEGDKLPVINTFKLLYYADSPLL
jgi:hypothetical protein